MRTVVILAGGKGKRLWPLSREERPKQFLKIGGKSLLRKTYERSASFVDKDLIYVVTGKKYIDQTLAETGLPKQNIIGEPSSKNTAPAIGLAATFISIMDEKAVMAVLPADHTIGKKEAFLGCLQDASSIASEGNCIVTLGIPPAFPATGYGYIKAAAPLTSKKTKLNNEAFKVASFVEKPDKETACRYLQGGGYFWNSGMFIFRVDKILTAIKNLLPELYQGLQKIKAHLKSEERDRVIQQVYKDLPSTSIDYGIMEKCENAVVIPADIDWNDVGDWKQMERLMEKDSDHNAVDGKHLGVETEGSIIYSELEHKLIATLGIENLVVVDTEDALLVMDKSRSQDLKEIVKKVEVKNAK